MFTQRWRRQATAEGPLRDEFLGAQRLDDRALAIAARFTVDPRARAKNTLPRFEENARMLAHAYRLLVSDVREGRFLTAASEWLLDNFHLISSQIADAHRNLPQTYYRELPPLSAPEHLGCARIYAIAIELVRHSDGQFERKQLEAFLSSYQRVAPLTMGELWAWSSMLTLALVENLRRLAEEILRARQERLNADEYLLEADPGPDRPRAKAWPKTLRVASIVQLLLRTREYGRKVPLLRQAVQDQLDARQMTAEDAVRVEHQRQGVLQVSVANAIASLRQCAAIDWRDFVESVSLVEHALLRDPAGAYGRMDFLSRDQQRHAVEQIADPSGEAQLQLALKVVDSARRAAAKGSMTDRAAHVGYHLIGPGRSALEADVAYRPSFPRRLGRLALRHPTPLYLGSIALVSASLLTAAIAWLPGIHGSRAIFAGALLLLLGPAIDLSIAFVQRLMASAIGPRRLPRLDLSNGVPEDARTMVVVPTLLTSPEAVAPLLEHLEVLAHGNLDPHIHFAILSDFVDAASPTRDEDAPILSAACEGVRDLNRRFGAGHADRFFLFHRERCWNSRQHVWMGWERKRGKIEEFNRLLRGATDTTFTTQVGESMILPRVRYCITLDTDTRLPRDAAKSLIGIIAHPLNRPTFDAHSGRVTEGYAILQPRVSVTMTSAAGSWFARLYAGHTGVDPYTTAVSDAYQDLFDEGIFTGKGLYDVDAFVASLGGRVPDNTLLSHDLFEGLYARTALVTDVEVVDDYPSSVLAYAKRQHRWVRGDWQILWWLLPVVPTCIGWRRNPLSLIARWKIFDNLRRSLMAPAIVALLLAGWTVLPGSALVWTAIGLGALMFPIGDAFVTALLTLGRRTGWRSALDDLRMAVARCALQAVFLASQAYDMVHAVIVTLVRVGVTRQRLLEWETSAATAHRDGLPDLRAFVRRMVASPLLAAGALLGVAVVSPRALPVALPLVLLWTAAPAVAFVLSRQMPVRREVLDAEDRAFLRDVAQKSWRYFETFMGPADHGLPPDNVQTTPDLRVAHRTSPTNIAMALLATVSAHDLEFIDIDDMVERLDATLTTVEGLERFEGHLLNWYDTSTLLPLRPAYVSTVDSGNLASALITLASGLPRLSSSGSMSMRTAGRLHDLAARAGALFDAMNFKPLYDPRRQLFAVGYRLADAEGAGRLDLSRYDLLASEARLASFLAIASARLTRG